MHFVGVAENGLFSVVFLFLKDFEGHIVDGRVVKDHDTAVGTRFDVYTEVFAEVIIASAKVIAYCLNCYIEFVSNFVHRTIGQTVFKTAKIVEGDCFCHDSYYLGFN